MANKTPHVVGGGLGSVRKQAKAAYEARVKAQDEANAKAAHQRFIRSLTK